MADPPLTAEDASRMCWPCCCMLGSPCVVYMMIAATTPSTGPKAITHATISRPTSDSNLSSSTGWLCAALRSLQCTGQPGRQGTAGGGSG